MRAARNHFFGVLLGFFLVVVPAQAQFTVYTNEAAFLGAINAGYYREVIPNAVFEELRSNNLPESRNFSSNGFSYALFSPEAPPGAGLYPTTVSGTFNGTNSDFVICASYPHLGLLFTNFSPNVSAVGGNFFPLDWGDRFTNTPISVTATLVNGSIYETNYLAGKVTSYLGLAFSGQSIASLRILNATNSPTQEYMTINNFTAATIGKTNATVALGNLLQTFNGSARPATATTIPSGLAVALTYNGSSAAPTNAGTYNVVATINNANYQGNASGTLQIAKANQTISFAGPGSLAFGNPAVSLSGTATSGLPLTYSVVSGPGSIAGTNLNVTGAGAIVLRAAQGGNGNYDAASSVDVTITVAKAVASVTLSNLHQTFNGAVRPVAVTTTPAGLTTTVLYNGSPTVPTNAGTYTVSATIDDPNYSGSANDTLVVAKAAATIRLGDLSQSYDGSAKSATAATTPAGLGVSLTYNGLSAAPTNAASYSVVATINDPNYEGNAGDTLTISKVTASVVLGGLSQTYDGSAKSATATTTPEGLTVDVTYNGNAQAPTSAGTYAVAATINDANYQGSTSATLSVAKASAGVVLGNLSQTYNGSARSATATTTPVGLAVDLTYNSSSLAPTNAGTYNVVATITDSNYEGSAGGNLVIAASAYQTWASDNSLNGVDADPSADPDKDGWSNALEFAFGLVPTSAGGQLLAVSGSGKRITFLQRSGVTYVVHSTTNVAAGFTGTITPEKSVPQPASLPSGYEQFEALFPSNSTRGFSKIEVTVQP